MARGKTWDQCKAECEAVIKDGYKIIDLIPPFKGGNSKLKCSCAEHGEYEVGLAYFLKSGKGCKPCGLRESIAKRRKTWEQFREELKPLESDKLKVLGFVGEWGLVKETDLRLLCTEHGEFTRNADKFKKGSHCRACALEGLKMPVEEQLSDCKAIAPDNVSVLGIVGEYIGSKTKLILSCSTHGEWRTTTINGFKSKESGCPACALVSSGMQRRLDPAKTIAELQKEAAPGITILGYVGEWIGSHTKLRMHCVNHGEWDTTTVTGFKSKSSKSGCSGCRTDQLISRSTKTLEEHLTDCRAAAKPGYKVIGIVPPFIGANTILTVECEKHGIFSTQNINKFKNRGAGCRKCRAEAIAIANALTWEKEKPILEDVAMKKGYKLIGLAGEWEGALTYLRLECSEHGEWVSTRLNAFRDTPCGCPRCGDDRVRKARIFTWEEYKKDCDAIAQPGVTVLGYIAPYVGSNTYLKCKCDIHGEWQTTSIAAFRLRGRCPDCANAANHENNRFSPEKMLSMCNAAAKPGIKVIGLVDVLSGTKSKVIAECEKHGEWRSTSVDKFVYGRSCPKCANQDHKFLQCYINLIGEKFQQTTIKFGIAVDSIKRLRVQQIANNVELRNLGVWHFETMKQCRAAEREVINTLPCKVLSVDEMPDGYTETTSLDNLEAVIAIYEKHGGTIKPVSLDKPKRQKVRKKR